MASSSSSSKTAAPAPAGGGSSNTSTNPIINNNTNNNTSTSTSSVSKQQQGEGGGLPETILRSLGDRSYEKRKAAALEVELLVKDINASPDVAKKHHRILDIIKLLVRSYAYSTQQNHRKGGLIALAATTIALMDTASSYLSELLPPVLKCFRDAEPRVRYYACESMYNITKVVRGGVLVFFNEVFDGLCYLYSDADRDVHNGAQLLDRLLKDVVTESDAFDVERFIPLLQERIKMKGNHERQLVVGWITVLDAVPDIDMLQFLPQYLGGLFDMLSDKQRDIRQQSFATLSEFLRELSEVPALNLGPMVPILVAQCNSRDNFTKLTALSWMFEFMNLGGTALLGFASSMIGAYMLCISDGEDEIRVKANENNSLLMEQLRATEEEFDTVAVVERVTGFVRNRWVSTRIASLRWMSMLLTKMPTVIYEQLPSMFPPLLQTLSDPEEQVVNAVIEVLARISLDKKNFEEVLGKIVNLFRANRNLLVARGSLVIRKLSVLLDGESIYLGISTILKREKDVEFASVMVQTLNLILLTSAELLELRGFIKNSLVSDKGRDLFMTLYVSWTHNPISTFSLCLLAQAYEMASELIFHVSDIEVTVGLLMQIDKLVQLIESPIFIHLRLQLLEPERFPYLVKSLYGILMLLPQSTAFTSLKTRLESAAPLFSLPQPAKKKTAPSGLGSKEVGKLLVVFQATQQLHAQSRVHGFQKNKLTLMAEEKKDE